MMGGVLLDAKMGGSDGRCIRQQLTGQRLGGRRAVGWAMMYEKRKRSKRRYNNQPSDEDEASGEGTTLDAEPWEC